MGPSFLGITDLMSPNFGVSSSGPNSMAAPLHPLHSKLVYSAEGKGSTAAAGPFYLWRKNCGGAAGVNPSHWLLAEFLTSHSRAVLCEPWAHREWRSNYFPPMVTQDKLSRPELPGALDMGFRSATVLLLLHTPFGGLRFYVCKWSHLPNPTFQIIAL